MHRSRLKFWQRFKMLPQKRREGTAIPTPVFFKKSMKTKVWRKKNRHYDVISNELRTQSTFQSCQNNLRFQQRSWGTGKQMVAFTVTATKKGCASGKRVWDLDIIMPTAGV